MPLNYGNFDDEEVKLDILETRVTSLLTILSSEMSDENAPSPALMEALAMATYALVLAQIEAYYWQYPYLARRLRTWVTAVLQTGSHQLTDDSVVFYAIKQNVPAAQLESLLDKFNEDGE